MVFKYIQNTFAGGIIRPELDPRKDLNNYYNSVREGNNVIFFTVGGVSNRAGSFFCGKTKLPDKKCRIIAFRFSIDEQYLIEIGDKYVRFWKDGELVKDNNTIVEITTGYLAEQLQRLNFVQSADVLYLLHQLYSTKELRRYSDTNWQIVDFDFTNGPFQAWNTDKTIKMQIFGWSQTGYYIASSNNYFTSGMVGGLFKISYMFSSLQRTYQNITGNSSTGIWFSRGGYKITTSGGWVGKIIIKKNTSTTSSEEWKEIKAWYSASSTDPDNINFSSELNEELAQYNIIVQVTAGSVNLNLTVNSFDYDFVCKILSMDGNSLNVAENKYSIVKISILNWFNNLELPYALKTYAFDMLLPIMSSDSENNIVLSGYLIDYLGETTNLTNIYKFFDNDYNSPAILSDDIRNKLNITYDASNNPLFASGKWANSISFETNVSSMPKKIKLIFSFQDVVTREITISNDNAVYYCNFPITKFDKINFELSEWNEEHQFKVYGIKIFGYTEEPFNYITDWWAPGAWNEDNGYPQTGSFYQDRLCLAGSLRQSFTVWASKTGIYNDFGKSDPSEDSDAIDLNLPSAKRDCPEIYNLLSLVKLLVLSSSGETTVELYPDVSQTPQSQRGSDPVNPLVVGNTILFAGQKGGSLRDLAYDFASDSYGSDDVTLKAKHLLYGKKIIRLAYAQDPNSIVYALLDDGSMLAITYVKEQNAIAFATFETDGQIEDIAVLDGGNYDDVYIVVKRNNERFIEKIPARIIQDEMMSNLCLDCSSEFKNVSVLTGLERFNDKEIVIACSDKTVKKQTVVNGEITLDKTYEKIIAGLPFICKIQTLDAVAENKQAGQTIVDCKARISRIEAQWLYSLPDKIGIKEDGLDDVDFNHGNKNLFSGLTTQSVNSSSSYAKSITYEHTTPWPFMLLTLITKLNVGEE
jgi:hypothetical protein